MSKCWRHVDVQAVIDEDELGAAIGFSAYEDVAWMRVAVNV